MKVRVQQLNPTIGDVHGNKGLIIGALKAAGPSETDLLILPELVVTGYPPMDLLEREAFLESVYQVNSEIVAATRDVKTAVIFGTVTPNTSGFGRKCYNSALVARDGAVVAEIHKTLLPTYDVFDDLRYFEPNNTFGCVELMGTKLGITICEDIWYNENDIQYHTYEVNPAEELAQKGAEAIVNISASPYTKTKPGSRQTMLQKHAHELDLSVFYANQVGANTDLIFDGDSMIIDADARIIARAPLFEESFLDVEWDAKANKVQAQDPETAIAKVPEKMDGMFKALVFGLRDYLEKTQIAEKVVLGLSGGIDSALTACIATEALGSENVLGVTMPSKFSSEGSVSDSEHLARNLGIELQQFSVKELYQQFLDVLEPLFAGTDFGVAEENLQSRIRGVLLMAISNKFGHMLLNTGNKSELATGYCTLYGDMAGGLGIISDLYKLEVYDMCRWLNEEFYRKEIIPNSIISKPPSAELKPAQKDSDSLPEYEVLDAILERYIEKQESIEEITGQGYDQKTVRKVVALVDQTEYKRFQAVPGLKVSTKSFGRGRRWPIVKHWDHN